MSSSSSTKVCFNSNCKEALERPRKGWRRRTGEFADLCDRCASAYEEGKFCETFHLNASGWRCCESCGKQIHCGCIVSFHMFVLLDAGGIECITCTRKSFILTPNPAWPPPHFLPVLPERSKDLSARNWCQIAGSGPVPWRQAPTLFSSSSVQSDMVPRMPFEVDIASGMDRLISIARPSASSMEKKKVEDPSESLMNGSLKHFGSSKLLENGNTGIDCVEQTNPCVNVPNKSSFKKNGTSNSHFGLAGSASPDGDQTKVSDGQAPKLTPPPLLGKQFYRLNGADPSGETQLQNARPRTDARVRNQLLPRYWPRITDQELQKISGDSNSIVTPLFEKMLSASDAGKIGKIGRLVLPKKCAETYFPPISQPEGLPLKVQDSKGKEWMFQFRFWPNNNSRMYVLEGVTPCIQSMQLQAGDIVTFSRIEPEGKLVMGFRKAITPPSDQGGEDVNACIGVCIKGEVSVKKTKPANPWPKNDTSGNVAKEILGAKSSFHSKRKNSPLGTKRLRIESEDLVELKLTWEQAQGLLRPPPNHVPSIVVIEGFEFEEYEDAPIIGRPSIFATDSMGKIQWTQCEDCFKWRKLPADTFLPSRWTCSENSSDPERSLCSVAQELTAEQLEDLLPTTTRVASKKIKVAKQDPDPVEEALEGLDALANLAIQDEGENLPASPSSQATTKHPRHRPGCTCIVCIQPPSGKGPKHKQTCTCNVCLTVKRRFQTLMLRREQKQSEKVAENARQKLQQNTNSQKMTGDDFELFSYAGNSSQNQKMVVDCQDRDGIGRSISPLKSEIDLNIQPERDEELLSGTDPSGKMRLVYDYKAYLMQLLPSINNKDSAGDQTQLHGVVPLGTNAPASTSGTERLIHDANERYCRNRSSAGDQTQLRGIKPSGSNAPPASTSGTESDGRGNQSIKVKGKVVMGITCSGLKLSFLCFFNFWELTLLPNRWKYVIM